VENDLLHRGILFPFTAIVGQDKLKLAMIINAVNPKIGGLLIRGPKGSGKTTAVRALRDVLPKVRVIGNCPYNCNPRDPSNMCELCSAKYLKDQQLKIDEREMRVVDLPLGATEDRVVGSLDIEKAIKHGIEALEPGILAEANQNVLYVDEINLLPDHIADDLLDAAATGWNIVEREGISVSHPSRFIFIGTMNPEEGQLRPQLLDRFPLSVTVDRINSVEDRMKVVKRNVNFEGDPAAFIEEYKPLQEELRRSILLARKNLSSAEMSEKLLESICRTCLDLKVDGLRPDIVISKAATALASFEDRKHVSLEDVLIASELALSHRTREGGFLEPASPDEIREVLLASAKKVGYKPEDTRVRSQAQKGKDSSEGKKGPQKREGRAIVFIKGDASKKLERFLRKNKRLYEAWKRLSQLYVAMNRMFGQVIIAFGRRLKLSNKGLPSVKAAAKSDKPLRGDAKDDGKQVSLKKIKGMPSISSAAKSVKTKKGFSIFKVFRRKERARASDLSGLSFKTRRAPRTASKQAGKRAEAITTLGRGRTSGWRSSHNRPRDIHLPATIRAAARKKAYKGIVKSQSVKTAVNIEMGDVREKLRRYKAPMTIVFVLDLSGSMMLNIDAVKEAIMKLHGDAYRYRDRVGIVALKDRGAVVAQHPVTNLRVVANRLLQLKISGYTPLASGLLKAWKVLKESRRRSPSTVPVMVIITDGSANVPLTRSLETGEIRSFEEELIIVREYEDLAVHDVVSVSKLIRKDGIFTIVVNTNPHLYGRETYGFAVTELIAFHTRGRLHTVGRMRSEPELVEGIIDKVAEDQRLIMLEASQRIFD